MHDGESVSKTMVSFANKHSVSFIFLELRNQKQTELCGFKRKTRPLLLTHPCCKFLFIINRALRNNLNGDVLFDLPLFICHFLKPVRPKLSDNLGLATVNMREFILEIRFPFFAIEFVVENGANVIHLVLRVFL